MRTPPPIVVTCEHASHRVPKALAWLGLPPLLFQRHVGWDPGAKEVAAVLAEVLMAPLHLGQWSRLVCDLNRSADHPRVIAPTVDRRAIPGNQLTAAQHAARLAKWWRPYRQRVTRDVDRAIAVHGVCLHLSIHSFVERLHGKERTNDFGLLYDPARRRERQLAQLLQAELQTLGFAVRCNFPYFGNTDALVTELRRGRKAAAYQGLEIEMNQRLARTVAGQRQLALALAASLVRLLAGDDDGDDEESAGR